MNRQETTPWRSPEKDFPPGTLIRFVCAPPRYKGDRPEHRDPGGNLLGQHGVILAGPYPDSHEWGGVFYVHTQGEEIRHWGDFMEQA